MSKFYSERLEQRHLRERQQKLQDLLIALALVSGVLLYGIIQAW